MIESDQELELAKGGTVLVGAGDRRDQSALPATASGIIECCLGGSTRYVRDGLTNYVIELAKTLALSRRKQHTAITQSRLSAAIFIFILGTACYNPAT